jgi:hypothetical protein
MASEAYAVDNLRSPQLLTTAEMAVQPKHPLDAPVTAISARVHGRKFEETPYSPNGNLYMHAGGYSYEFYNKGARQNSGVAFKPLRGDERLRQLQFLASASVTGARHNTISRVSHRRACYSFRPQPFLARAHAHTLVPRPCENRHVYLAGSGRDRTSRIVEPTSHELRIVDQQRKINILTHGALDTLRLASFGRRAAPSIQRPMSSAGARPGVTSARAMELAISTAKSALEAGACIERDLASTMERTFTTAYGPTHGTAASACRAITHAVLA